MTRKLGFWDFVRSQFANLPYPDVSVEGKTIIVTGSNAGLGKEAARHMARLNAENIVLAVRNIEKGESAKADILKSLPNSHSSIHVQLLDQNDFSSVKSFADRVISEFSEIHIAILNAGIATKLWNTTKDGWEATLQTNVLSTTYLATLLLPKLQASYKVDALLPHLTIVSSEVHFWAEFNESRETHIFKTLNDENKSNKADRYQVSKLLNIYTAEQLGAWVDQRMNGKVVVNTVNPGLCQSELNRDGDFFFSVIKLLLARTTEAGSRNLVWASTAAGIETNGKYTSNCMFEEPSGLVTTDDGQRISRRVWKEMGNILVEIDPGVQEFFN